MAPTPDLALQSAAGRYTQLATDREPFLRRARAAALVTIPSLIPPEGHDGKADFPTPFQSLGADGVKTLSAKLLVALMPPNVPWFKYELDETTIEELTGRDAMRGEVDNALARQVRTVMTDIEGRSLRASSQGGFQHLIVGGNVLFYLPPEGTIRAYGLDRYVVRRGSDGVPREIILEEEVDPSDLPEGFLDVPAVSGGVPANKSAARTLKQHTVIRLDGNRYRVHQEVAGKVLPKSKGSYPKTECPWLPLRWSWTDGEDYGRGHCSDHYLGDLLSFEALSKAMVEGAAAAARVIPLVNPNGVTREEDLQDAENFDFVPGTKDDVTFLQMDKHADFRVAADVMDKLEARLGRAFMLTASIQRQGERVTAEEIRLMASDLEDNLGGVYSILSQEFQLPLVRRVVAVLARKGRLKKLPEEAANLVITAGLAALGRGHDLARMTRALGTASNLLGPEIVAAEVKPREIITRILAAESVETNGLLKTEKEKQDEATARMQQQALMTGLPNAINQMGQMAQAGAAPAA